jgi:hypothetical protein
MEEWTIDAVARMLAEELYEEPDWSASHEAVRQIVMDKLAAEIKAHIRTLAGVGAIRPRCSVAGPTADALSAPDDTYMLTRADADEVLHFVRLSKIDLGEAYIEKFDKLKTARRCTVKQAARIIAPESGERFETILDWLKADALNGHLSTYGSGRIQPIKYDAARYPRDDDEAVWEDLNRRLETTNIAFRFPSPNETIEQAKKNVAPNRREIPDPAADHSSVSNPARSHATQAARRAGQRILDANPSWKIEAVAKQLHSTGSAAGRGGRTLSIETIRKALAGIRPRVGNAQNNSGVRRMPKPKLVK